jgi:hypothetical protein
MEKKKYPKKTYQEIIIEWSERKRIKTPEDFKQFDIKKENVLYQIYGDHHIYGRNTLLYIGRAGNADARIKTHLEKSFFQFVNNCSVSIGTIKPDDDLDVLEMAESILIASHKPSLNKEFIHDIAAKAKEHKIIVINNGNNEMLKTCCTNYWWVEE